MPLVTLTLVLANLFAYALELASGGDATCQAHGLVPARFVVSGDFGPVFSGMFLHDPHSWTHIIGNMVSLSVVGTVVEREIGSLRTLAVYLAAGVAGGLLHVVVDPTATDALVGASGAIFGLLAVAAVARPRMIGFVVGFGLMNVWYAFAGTGGAVSFGDHLGGLFAGMVFAMVARISGRTPCEAA